MTNWKLALAACAVVLPASAVSAQAIFSPTAAVITLGGPGFGSINDTFNHNGLLTNFTSDVTNFNTYIAGNPKHSLVFAGNEWFSNDGSNAATVIYDLGSSRSFDRFALWNEDFAGVGSVQLSISSDNVTFTPFTSFNPVDTPNNTDYGPQVFSFGTQTGRYVRFAATNCPQQPAGFNSCAIGEVAFRAAGPAVPEPATWALMLAGFGLAGAAIRGRRANAVLA